MILDRSTALAWPICLALFNAPGHAADKTPADLVVVRQGTLPIILTVPHGGREEIPGAAPRDTRGKPSGGRGFVTVTDTNRQTGPGHRRRDQGGHRQGTLPGAGEIRTQIRRPQPSP
jgi:hypothetical protein